MNGIRSTKRSLMNCQPYKTMYMKGPKEMNAGDVAYGQSVCLACARP